MPIHFKVDKSGGYFVSTYIDEVSDDELLRAYREFFDDAEWRPGLHELVDVSAADVTALTASGLRALVEFATELLEERGVTEMLTAIYAPRDLPYGMGRMYQFYSDESPESVRVFRGIAEAKAWLEEQGT